MTLTDLAIVVDKAPSNPCTELWHRFLQHVQTLDLDHHALLNRLKMAVNAQSQGLVNRSCRALLLKLESLPDDTVELALALSTHSSALEQVVDHFLRLKPQLPLAVLAPLFSDPQSFDLLVEKLAFWDPEQSWLLQVASMKSQPTTMALRCGHALLSAQMSRGSWQSIRTTLGHLVSTENDVSKNNPQMTLDFILTCAHRVRLHVPKASVVQGRTTLLELNASELKTTLRLVAQEIREVSS